MKYNYRCTNCHEWRVREWDLWDKKVKCENCEQFLTAPHPSLQMDAWVDQHDPPDVMERTAYFMNRKSDRNPDKEDLCTVPWCDVPADHLDHREPYQPGRTCVENLFPMCGPHNQSKGRKNYGEWLEEPAQQMEYLKAIAGDGAE